MQRFKNRTSKFGSFFSLCTLITMLAFFAANVTLFSESVGGLGFAGIWLVVAIIMVISHIIRLMPPQRQPAITMASGHKDARTRNKSSKVRAVRGF